MGAARTARAQVPEDPPRLLARVACTAYNRCMQYTIRSIPSHVDQALRERSAREGKSLNEVVVEALERGLDLEGHPVRRRDLSAIAGSWVRDREVDRALDDQRTIDPDLWR
jgi:plasmid stability protein